MAVRFGGTQVFWFGAELRGRVKRGAGRGILLGCEHLKVSIMRRLSVSSRSVQGARFPKKPAPGRKARKPMLFKHSRPGEPPRFDTGKLRQSIYKDVDRAMPLGVVGTHSKIGVMMEKGTRAHVIAPKRKKSLVYGGTRDGVRQWIFARRIHHPGTKKRPFIKSTLRRERREISRLIFREIRAAIR